MKFTGRSLGIAGVGAVGEAISASINSTSPASMLSQLVPSVSTSDFSAANPFAVGVAFVGVFSDEPLFTFVLDLEDNGEPLKTEREGLGLPRPLLADPR